MGTTHDAGFLVIDGHGHYTITPDSHQAFRDAQLRWLAAPEGPAPQPPKVSDDEIRHTIETNQLLLSRSRGIDLTLFSPRAAGMEHHVKDPGIAGMWARQNNDLIHRVVSLFPDSFSGVCQLPQVADSPLDACIDELRRCVIDLGFVGCNLNPDPSGGYWSSPSVTDEYWYPLYETMTELGVPAMVHVSASCNPGVHATGAHYLNADTTVFMQLVEGDLFGRFPDLRLVIPHGGGAVPYHWGRYRGLSERLGRPPLEDHVMRNVMFDTCVYHQPGIDLLCSVIDVDNLIFASEMLGAVRSIDPETGHHYDDTKRYLEASTLSAEELRSVFEGNVRRVYPRLDYRLKVRSGLA